MSTRDAFTAIADPTRRHILDLLYREGQLAAGEIGRHFVNSSRPGVSRHLRVLRECGVVRVRSSGKEKLYTIHEEPLKQLKEGWLAKFGDMQTDSLRALRSKVERGE